MKIAVITFSDFNTNYGSMLQAFALKCFLEEFGHKITFVRYREFNKPESQSFMSACILSAKRAVLSTYRFIKRNDIQQRNENFKSFKECYIKHTPLCVTSEDFAKLPEFDCYICGSDQIWNINCLGGLRKPYLLDFAPKGKRKIAYAASMGDYLITQEYEKDFKRLINELDAISVREKESIPQLQRLTEKKIHHVVDPTFLISAEQWDSISGPSLIEGDYAVCYLVRRSKFCRQIIKKLRNKYGIPIYNLSDNQIYISGTSSKFISVGPMEFVSLVKHAKFTVGTSFHLAAFSIIFKIPFIIAGIESNRTRINNLLSMAKLENRFVTNETDLNLVLDHLFDDEPDVQNIKNYVELSNRFLLSVL